MRRYYALTASLLFFGAAACSSGTQDLGDAGGNPDAVATNTDAAPADTGVEPPDAGFPDTGPPVRQLVEVKLFGDMPLDNAVLDPQFDPSSQSWLAFGDLANGGRFVRTSFRELALTPAKQPVLFVQNRATDPADTVVLGSVMAVQSPLNASVWIGRDQADLSIVGAAVPSLIMTLAASGEEQSFDLMPDAATAPVTLDALVWQKYSATITDASIGIVSFAVQDPAHKPLYISAPVVVGRQQLRASGPVVRPRALTYREARAANAMSQWRRRRLGDGRKIEPEVPTEALRGALRRR